MTFYINNISDLHRVSSYLIDMMKATHIFLLEGGLGAGKTTLVKQWMKDLQVEDLVSSPTFSLINEYRWEDRSIYHMDMYRLHDLDEAYNIGIKEYLYNESGYCIIEWPKLIMPLIDLPYVVINMEVRDEYHRIIDVEDYN